MEKQTMVHHCNGILFSSRKEQNTETWDNMDESHMRYSKWKYPDSESYLFFIPFIWLSGKTQIIGTENRSVGAMGWVRRRGWLQKIAQGDIPGWWNSSYLNDYGGGYTGICISLIELNTKKNEIYRVQSLVGVLRSHKPHGAPQKPRKQNPILHFPTKAIDFRLA